MSDTHHGECFCGAVKLEVTGAPVAIFYATGVFFSVCAGVLLLLQLLRALTGRLRDSELVMVKESEEQAELENLQAELARGDAQPGHPHANPSIGR